MAKWPGQRGRRLTSNSHFADVGQVSDLTLEFGHLAEAKLA
jgi:hypothetical protein